ncbi:MAG: ATP-binding protein [Planctomycetes bacterium]|nr:ATP-binding protein [Planctomycetota bacterium]
MTTQPLSDVEAKLTFQRTLISELTAEDISNLVSCAAQEDQNLEFKRNVLEDSTNPAKTELRKDISGLANGGGGTLIIGVDEDKDSRACFIYGIVDAVERMKRIEAVLMDCIDPPLKGLVVRCMSVDDKDVIIIRVESPDLPPHCIQTGQWKRRFPIRQGRSIRPLTMLEIRQSMLGDRLAHEVHLLNDKLNEFIECQIQPADLTSLGERELLDLTNPLHFSKEVTSRISEKYNGRPCMCVLSVPNPLHSGQVLRQHQDKLRDILLHPPDVRKHAWFIRHGEQPRRVPLGLGVHDERSEMSVIICWNGSTVFHCALDTEGAQWAYQELSKKGSPVLNPFAYIEPIVCTIALAKKVAETASIEEVDLYVSMINAANVRLTRYAKNSVAVRVGRLDAIRPISEDNVLATLPGSTVTDLSDTTARELILEVYAEIGFDTTDQDVLYFDNEGNFQPGE